MYLFTPFPFCFQKKAPSRILRAAAAVARLAGTPTASSTPFSTCSSLTATLKRKPKTRSRREFNLTWLTGLCSDSLIPLLLISAWTGKICSGLRFSASPRAITGQASPPFRPWWNTNGSKWVEDMWSRWTDFCGANLMPICLFLVIICSTRILTTSSPEFGLKCCPKRRRPEVRWDKNNN